MKDEVAIEQLVEMVQKGFAQTVTKDDFKMLKRELDDLRDRVDYGFNAVNAGIDDFKASLGEPPVNRQDFDDLTGRVKYVEAKLGVESGK